MIHLEELGGESGAVFMCFLTRVSSSVMRFFIPAAEKSKGSTLKERGKILLQPAEKRVTK